MSICNAKKQNMILCQQEHDTNTNPPNLLGEKNKLIKLSRPGNHGVLFRTGTGLQRQWNSHHQTGRRYNSHQ